MGVLTDAVRREESKLPLYRAVLRFRVEQVSFCRARTSQRQSRTRCTEVGVKPALACSLDYLTSFDNGWPLSTQSFGV